MHLRAVVGLSLFAVLLTMGLTSLPVSAATKTCFGHVATQTAPVNGMYNLTNGDDVIVGTSRADSIGGYELGGTDFICTGGGDNNVSIMIEGSKTIDTGSGNDYINLIGGSGQVTVTAGSGSDRIYSYLKGANLDGGSGNDEINSYGSGATVRRCETSNG